MGGTTYFLFYRNYFRYEEEIPMARENGSGSFRKLSSGKLEYTVSIGFDDEGVNQRKRFYGATKNECKRKHDEYKAAVAAGEKPKPRAVVGYTVSGWLEFWLRTHKGKKVSKATYKDYVGLANHVKGHRLGDIKLADVLPMDVTEYFADKSDYSHSFIKRMKYVLTAAFEAALDNDQIKGRNPVRRAEIIVKEQPEKEAFSEDEVRAIIEFAKTDKRFGLPVYIMFNTGVRSQEIRAMVMSQIDFNSGIITIDRAINRSGELDKPKNKKTRYIPVKPEVLEFIKTETVGKTGYILGETTYVTKSGFESRYRHFVNRLNKGLVSQGRKPIDGKSPHASRHSCATLWQKRGMPLAMVSALLGHSSTEVTDKYTHVKDTSILSEAVQKYGISV
jgi:integrase